jgi:hypothetical protein
VPTNYAGYVGYAERAKQQQFDQWQGGYGPEYAEHEEAGTADYSGAAAAAYAHTEQVFLGYGPGFPHRAPPQYLPSHPSHAPASEICLLEADIATSPVSPVHEWWTSVTSARGQIHFKVDTGARGNICSLCDLHQLGYTRAQLLPSNVYLLSFEKRVVRSIGTLITRVKVNVCSIPFVLHVVPQCNSPLLSLADLVQVGLVKLPPLVITARPPQETEPIDEFNAYNWEIMHLELRADATPKQFPPGTWR